MEEKLTETENNDLFSTMKTKNYTVVPEPKFASNEKL